MDNNIKIIKALRLFNEKAEKLSRLSFIHKVIHPDSGVTISSQRRNDGFYEQNHERRSPEEESIDAFVLTFRFFIQDNEQISFRNMDKYYTKAPIEEGLKTRFAEVRKDINEFLDRSAEINFIYNNELLTNRRIMETFIYGGMSHANEAKKELYDEWMKIPFTKVVLEYEFTNIIAMIFKTILYIKTLNEQSLQHLTV